MTGKRKIDGPFTIGLDIGIASVGWAVLGENRIIDLGVRCFDKAETAKEGESLNLARRTARLMRRRLRRRAWRLTKLARLLKREGLISDVNILKQPPAKGFKTPNLWKLRVQALDHKLDSEEWARVIYHLCKHRGFHWISRAEAKAAESDKKVGGPVKKGLADTRKSMEDKHYRSAAEMVLSEFPCAQRNKQGDYGKALSRELLADELALLFERQREIGNVHASTELQGKVLELFWAQKPPLSGAKLLEMVGHCTFEKKEKRAPKASFTAERHVWLTRLNNLRIVVDGKPRSLTKAERQIALPLPYETGELKYGKLRKALVKAGLSNDIRFAGLAYPSEKQKKEEKAKDPEDQKLSKMPAWQELRKALKDKGLETEWQLISVTAIDGIPQLLDQISWVLSVFKEDEEVAIELRKLDLPNEDKLINALLDFPRTSFKTFHALSLKALYKILPHMEAGLRYDEACVKSGYHHSQPQQNTTEKKELYLPPLYEHRRGKEIHNKDKMIFSEKVDQAIQGGIPRNPVVLRALNQARKVVNALIWKYGSPYDMHIEMARDLSRPIKERKKVEDAQKEFQNRNDKDKEQFTEYFGRKPKDNEFEKFRLYREQQCKSIYPAISEDKSICAYSFVPIDLERLLEPGYVEIDHALPYRRSFDDSKNNRVLVLAHENRNKGNMTPYEYLDGEHNSEQWRQYVLFVESNKSYRQAKRNRLLRKDFGEKDAEAFRERNLNDTRYICKFFKNYIEQYLQLHTDSKAKRCVVISGSLTSLLRARWGLPTSKEKRKGSDRHHAMDAVVVAACGHRVVKRFSTFINTEGWTHKPGEGGYVNTDTGEFLATQDFIRKDEVYKLFPRPWKHFRAELLDRLNTDTPDELRAKLKPLGTYSTDDLEEIRPLFVSRAPQRRSGGALHKETIYGKNQALSQSTVTKRKDVGDLKEGDLIKIICANEPRNKGLITSLHQWLKSQEELKEITVKLGKGKSKIEATQEEKERIDELSQLPRKPLKSDPENGPFTGPIIKKVKLIETSKSGAYVRKGIAELGKVVRTKLYRHRDEFVFLPRYELPDEKLFGLASIPSDAIDTGIELYGNEVVRIEHLNLAYCYKTVRTYQDKITGEKLIDIVAAFPSGVFLGYWAYFEPSNNRPVVQLHDSASFFLLEANKTTKQQEFTLVAKEKKTKGDTINNKTYEYIEKSPPLDRKAFKFSLEKDIKRQIGSAKSFEKLHVDVLGNLYGPAGRLP